MNEFLFDDKPFDIVRKKADDKKAPEQHTHPFISDILAEVGKIRLEILRMQKRAQIQSRTETGTQESNASVSLMGPEITKVMTYLEHVIREIRGFKPELLSVKSDLEDALVVDCIKDMLPVVDALNRVMDTMKDAIEDPRLKSWFFGIRQIYSTLMLVFKQHEVEEIQVLEQAFNPKYHAAIATVEDSSKPDGMIVRVERSGFIRKNYVIRYPEVIVVRNKSD